MTLQEKYLKKAIPAMKEQFGYKNNLAVPKIVKVTVGVGLNRNLTEKDPKYIEIAEGTIAKITGQKPVKTLAKTSISGFKIREGLVVGLKVTLRGKKMYDFIEKLIGVVLPRTRDFRGLSSKSVDERGNFSLGFSEQIAFPEISPESAEKMHGLQVTVTTNAKNKEEGLALLKLMDFPFAQK